MDRCLYDRQGNAADFLIDVEGIDIGHTTDIIDDGHEACFDIRGVDIVLATDATDEVLRVETLRMYGSIDELLHECLDDLITG